VQVEHRVDPLADAKDPKEQGVQVEACMAPDAAPAGHSWQGSTPELLEPAAQGVAYCQLETQSCPGFWHLHTEMESRLPNTSMCWGPAV
jgi:hypothetical protein